MCMWMWGSNKSTTPPPHTHTNYKQTEDEGGRQRQNPRRLRKDSSHRPGAGAGSPSEGKTRKVGIGQGTRRAWSGLREAIARGQLGGGGGVIRARLEPCGVVGLGKVDVREDLTAKKAGRQGRGHQVPERCTSSASWYQGVGDEALGTTEGPEGPGSVFDEATGVVGVANVPAKCGNMEKKRELMQVSLTCLARSPFTHWGSEAPRSARRGRLEVRRGGSAKRC